MPLDGTGSLGGVPTPLVYGPFPLTDFPGTVTQMIPEPIIHPMTCLVTVVSYSGSALSPLSASPTVLFTIPVTGRRSSGTAYTGNPSTFSLLSDTQRTIGGVLYESVSVSQIAPADPTFQGVVYAILDPSGGVYWESAPLPAATATLTFPTPGTPGVYTVYACGWDGTNINPIVIGITPSFTVSIGTTAGTIASVQLSGLGSGVSTKSGQLAIAYGAGLDDDGSGLATVKVTGPLYLTISGQLNLQLAGDFTVSAGVLTQNTVDLAKAINFDTTNFSISGGSLVIDSIALNHLIVGTALFTGTATFAYTTGQALQIGAAGAVLCDNYASPTCTVTVTASGATVAKGSNSMAVTASGWAVSGPSGSMTGTSGGITITNTNVSTQVAANQIQMVYTGGGTMTLNSSGLEFVSGNYNLLLGPAVGAGSVPALVMYANGNTLEMTSAHMKFTDFSGHTLTMDGTSVALVAGSYSFTLTASAATMAYGSNNLQLLATGVTITAPTCKMELGTNTGFPNSAIFTYLGTATYITGNSISTGSITVAGLNITVGVTFNPGLSYSSATAGSATLPANPVGFLLMTVGSTGYKVPYYAS
jgi:hypothetical protein